MFSTVAIRDADGKWFEWRTGRSSGSELGEVTPIPLEDMVACLRKLRKSVDFWTKRGGRQGYMQYIEQYVG
jgi:hypothetical protein